MTIDLSQAEDFKTIYLLKGTPAPNDGYLWSSEKTLNAIQQSMERDLYKVELDKAYTKIEKLESKNEWEKWLWVGSGIILTVLAGWSLGQVAK